MDVLRRGLELSLKSEDEEGEEEEGAGQERGEGSEEGVEREDEEGKLLQ